MVGQTWQLLLLQLANDILSFLSFILLNGYLSFEGLLAVSDVNGLLQFHILSEVLEKKSE